MLKEVDCAIIARTLIQKYRSDVHAEQPGKASAMYAEERR